ncbi:uncharacterized protein [Argopecten irradians]|uniref:uncharacterized protein isoform X1 n=1 Tax=Argopecten irradians TaxID=31199 RepID=UPI003712F500
MAIWFLATVLVLGETFTEAAWLELTNVTCAETSHVVEDGSSSVTPYYLTWDGRKLPGNCRVGFNITHLDQFQLCVNVEAFSLETCAFHMQYFDGSSMKQIINCGTLKKEYCVASNELFIKFTTSQKTSSMVTIKVTAKSRADKSVLIAIGCVLSAAAFGAFFVTMYALRRSANNEGKSCLIWKCLDVCIPEKTVQPSLTLDYTLHTISLPRAGYINQNQYLVPGGTQPLGEVSTDPPPPYEPPPPSYEEVHNPKFEGRINIQECAISDVRTELTFSGMRL